MLFNSFNFLQFFIIVTFIYYLLPHKLRWILLLGASYYFYMSWRPELIILIVFVTFINFFAARRIGASGNAKKKKRWLFTALFISFGMLFIFKYSMFISNSLLLLFEKGFGFYLNKTGLSAPEASLRIQEIISRYPLKEFDIILPMGISFYTFQAVGYTIDVYNGRILPEKRYGIFSLFITFFPQLVAGPIERSKNLLPQFYEKHKFSLENLMYGGRIMLLGFFKKVVIADRVAVAVNTIYNSPENFSGLYFVLATLLFTFQIYCDFSGYSDIAIGCSKILGFDLMTNFQNPYFSCSIKDFWRRWHISLSTWFMDYLYIPLGGSKCGKLKQIRNLLITFIISGLWHGANLTFILWGAFHGILLVLDTLTKSIRKGFWKALHLTKTPIPPIFGFLITFPLVCFGWIFFRANSVSDMFYIIRHLLWDFRIWNTPQYLYYLVTNIGLNIYELKIAGLAILLLCVSEIISGKETVTEFMGRQIYLFQLAFYVLIGGFLLTSGVFYDAGAFIYFQF